VDRIDFVRSLAAALAAPAVAAPPALAANPFGVLVLGDSIAWGQGLRPDHRWRALLERRVALALGRLVFEVPSDVHSGATIGIGDRGQIEERPRDHVAREIYTPLYADPGTATASGDRTANFEQSFLGATASGASANYDGEIPSSTPTVLRQLDEFDAGPNSATPIDLVLVSAGINDVGVTRLLDPLANRRYVAEAVDAHCHHHLVALLDRIRVRFLEPNPRCVVVVLSYYPMIGAGSVWLPPPRVLLSALLTSPTATRKEVRARSVERGAVSLAGDINASGDAATQTVAAATAPAKPVPEERAPPRSLVAAASRFFELSERAIDLAVREANRAPFSAGFIHVTPDIDPNHAVFSSDPELWSLRPRSNAAEDEVARERAEICRTLGDELHDIPPSSTQECTVASLGHPNVAGAERYADAIWSALAPQLAARGLTDRPRVPG
jgi:lysophospholipase L1-like esterase